MENQSNLKLITRLLRLISLILLICSLFVPFAPAIKTVVSSDSGKVVTTYSPAFAFLFGGKITSGRISYSTNGIAGVATAAYILVLLSCVALAAHIFLKKDSLRKWFVFGALASILISSILFLASHGSAATALADALVGGRSDSVVATMIRNASLEFGLWGMALFGFPSTALLAASFVFDGTIDKIRAKILTR